MESNELVARGAAYSLVSRGIARGLSLIVAAVLARQLGTAEWGLYGLGLTYVALISKFQLVGLGNALVYFLPRYRQENDWARVKGTLHFALSLVAVLGIVFGGVIFLNAKWMSGWVARVVESEGERT